MRLTTKGRFAVTAMADLAKQDLSKPVTLLAISGRQKISLSYLEQLFGKLRRESWLLAPEVQEGVSVIKESGKHITSRNYVRGRREDRCDAVRRKRKLGG